MSVSNKSVGSDKKKQEVTEMILKADEGSFKSSETPMSQWSSLLLETWTGQGRRGRGREEDGEDGEEGSGGLCAGYLAMSDSAVLRHPYYSYPAVHDPGIRDALFINEKAPEWPEDGQALYLHVCDEMGTCPARLFHKALLAGRIDLSYYGVDPGGVRAMCLALSRNRSVLVLDLTDNWLTEDACYHLGRLLLENSTLTEINLTGCRIGVEGLRMLLDPLPYNRTLRGLNLADNRLGDRGAEALALVLAQAQNVVRLVLARNSLGAGAAAALAAALEFNNKLTHLDLSWNLLFAPQTALLLGRLAQSKSLMELNISWNALCGPRVGLALRALMTVPTLRSLDLSNNRLCTEAIASLASWMFKAKRLHTLDLSCNPLTPEDAVKVLSKMKLGRVKVENLRLDNVWVDRAFLELLQSVKQKANRRDAVITYGGVRHNYQVVGPDPRELILRRASFLATKPKKKPLDLAVFLLTLYKQNPAPLPCKELTEATLAAGAVLDDDLADEMAVVFPGPKVSKGPRAIDLAAVCEYVRRLWPDARPPPTPPPTPPPPPPPEPKGKKGKGKGKKK